MSGSFDDQTVAFDAESSHAAAPIANDPGSDEPNVFSADDLNAHRTYLLKVANRLLQPRIRPRVSPSDLVQQSVVIALNRFWSFRGSSLLELRSWLEGILRNEYRNCRRKHEYSAKRGVFREVSVETLRSHDNGWDFVDDRNRNSETERELWERVRQEAKRLSRAEAAVFNLAFEHQLSIAEIAAQLGLTEKGARKRYDRAMNRLRQRLGWKGDFGFAAGGGDGAD